MEYDDLLPSPEPNWQISAGVQAEYTYMPWDLAEDIEIQLDRLNIVVAAKAELSYKEFDAIISLWNCYGQPQYFSDGSDHAALYVDGEKLFQCLEDITSLELGEFWDLAYSCCIPRQSF